MNRFDFTRSSVQKDHALLTPESHVRAPLPGWHQTHGVTLISPQMGARFTQYLALLEAESTAGLPLPGVERFVFVLEGVLWLEVATTTAALTPGGYAYIPPDSRHTLTATHPSRIVVIERRHTPTAAADRPAFVVGREQEVEAKPFMGDPDAQLKTLLPESTAFDMAVNVFTFNPGAHLPFVEVHVMEHGLLMLAGEGIYRLGENWYPVQAGDAIWIAPYCPQWFAAIGKVPARYIYYKDVNRDPLCYGDG